MPEVDHAALDAFLATVERRALRMAEIATRDRDAALDIVQDAMFRLVRRYARRPAQEWPPLFYRCVQNGVRDWQRRQTVWGRLFFRIASVVDEETGEPALHERPDPDAPEGGAQLEREQTMSRIERALLTLPTRQREAFMLRVWEGLDVGDTAIAMACSEGSVKTHLSRALASLRVELQGEWP